MYKDLDASTFSEWVASTERKSMKAHKYSFPSPSFANERQSSFLGATKTVHKDQNPQKSIGLDVKGSTKALDSDEENLLDHSDRQFFNPTEGSKKSKKTKGMKKGEIKKQSTLLKLDSDLSEATELTNRLRRDSLQ